MSAYREAGFLPEAIDNYLALLGWSVGDDEDVASLDEMITRFDLSTVSKNPAVFDPQKLEWLNGVYIRSMTDDEFVAQVLPSVEADLGRGLTEVEHSQLVAMTPLVKERTKLLPEVADQVRFLFSDIDDYDDKSWAKVMDKPEGPVALDAALSALSAVDPWTTESIEVALRGMLEDTGLNARKGFQPIRVAISGSTVSPPLFESLEILGKAESLERLRRARSAMG
jgi:glutamyl-tRNA synthetase